ncbi:MAG: polysaccharide biosynthesis protein [Clostridiales bacterium]|nr:polysaccharide biosynthesis protein [Clostridiales bacterium]
MKKPQKSLVGGISILGIAGLICKAVGVLYKIPLAGAIGPEGMAVYHQVFPTYNLMLTISSAGIPVAISRMISGFLVRDDRRSAHATFNVALLLLGVVGMLGMLAMVGASPFLARASGSRDAQLGFIMIAPSLFFVCVMSAFRGFMQGRRRMVPTAISQLIEQVGKVAVALPLAAWGMARGGFAMGAAGALLGTSIAEAVALVYMMADERRQKPAFDALPQAEMPLPRRRALARELTWISVPITIGACIVPLAGAVDSFMLITLMSDYLPIMQARISFGVYTGLVLTLINVPTALAMATAANLVPAISASFEQKEYGAIAHDASAGLRVASVIGFPSAVGMSLLAEPILFLLFGRSGKYSAADLQIGARLLEISSLTILLFTQVQATSGILQGLHKQRIPMITLAIGVALKVLVNYTLVRIPEVGISGAPYASLICYAVSLAPNLYYVARYTRMRIRWDEVMVKPAAATIAMALPVLLMRQMWGERLNTSWTLLGVAVLTAAAVFFVAAFAVGAIRRSDLPKFLKGKKK